MKSQIKKAIAILLLVCFLVSVTSMAVSAVGAACGELDDPEDKVVNEKYKEEKEAQKEEKNGGNKRNLCMNALVGSLPSLR